MNKSNSLTPAMIAVIQQGATEPVNHYVNYENDNESGSYLCRQCGLALFRAMDKFESACGWPSFDAALDNVIRYLPDRDGYRTEIRCQRCDGHLGHVFYGEGLTDNNTRYCVNRIALDMASDSAINDSEEAIFAGGCFWRIQHVLQQAMGVVYTEVGYCGGNVAEPTYPQVCRQRTGHREAVRILYDPQQTSYEALTTTFLGAHDPTQTDGQGADIGPQYQSAIFYHDQQQQHIAQRLLQSLRARGLRVATLLIVASPFWLAEPYHQHYYQKQQSIR